MMFAQAQTWVGVYTVDSTVCDVTQCCCFSGSLTLSQPTASVLRVNSAVNGALCGGTTVFQYDGIYPSGYVTSLGTGPGAVGITLSADSQNLTAVSPMNAACNGKAARVGSVPATTVKPISGAEKHLISSMAMAAAILLAAITHIAHR